MDQADTLILSIAIGCAAALIARSIAAHRRPRRPARLPPRQLHINNALQLAIAAVGGVMAAQSVMAFSNSGWWPYVTIAAIAAAFGFWVDDLLSATHQKFIAAHSGERSMDQAKISVIYTSELDLSEYPTIFVGVENEQIQMEALGESVLGVAVDLDKPIRILLRVRFPKSGRSVSALAQSWNTRSIHLQLVKSHHMVGTIQAERFQSLSADVVGRECDITCLPPAKQTAGPARCVVCTDNDGTFELCC